jgi:hypothetical protein
MYHLLSRIDDGIKPMLDVLQAHVTTYGLNAIKGIPEASAQVSLPFFLCVSSTFPHLSAYVKDPVKYVNTLLEVYNKFNDVVLKAFEQDPAFVATLDRVL